jgi:hypothetical protein
MADSTPPLQFVEGEADGYCDPATGVCLVPGAAVVSPATEAWSPEKASSTSPGE